MSDLEFISIYKSLPIDRINRAYNALKCPRDVYDPTRIPLKNNKYFVICSERSIGKTTNILLWGMCAHEICGTQIQYIRQREDMLAPKNAKQLFDTIIQFGYIPKVTRGKWNFCEYHAHGWTYCNVDAETGEIIERDKKPFMMCLSIDNNQIYKSSYNAALGDVIIFDEFCSKYYAPDEFVSFCDLLKTIIRERKSPIIFMLGNTLDRYNQYFSEMELLKITTSMQLGAHTETVTAKGTPIYVEFPTRTKTPAKFDFNRLYYGFHNKKLGAITGDDWVIVPMQHIDKNDHREIILKNLYIIYEDTLINLELCRSEKHGTHVCAHFAKRTYDDSRIYSVSLMYDYRYRYKLGNDKLDRIIWTLYERKKFYYANNTVGALIDKYVDTCKRQRSLY